MRPVLPADPLLFDQFQVRLVNQCGGAEGESRPFGSQVLVGHDTKLLINSGEKQLHGISAPVGDNPEDTRQIARRTVRHKILPQKTRTAWPLWPSDVA